MAVVELGSTYLLNDATLRAYYKLENTDDQTSNNYDLTNNGTTTFAAAKFNNGADFGTTVNGVKSLSIASDLGVSSGAISISMWVKLRSEITVSSGYYYFVEKSSTTNVAYIIRYNYNSGTPRLEFVRSRVGAADDMVTYNITLGTADFYHLVMTYDGTSIRGYVNGALVGSPVSSSGVGVSGGSNKMYIGARITGSATQTDVYSANGSFSVPSGVTSIIVEAWGGGGGGRTGGGGGTASGGGGGGGYSKKTIAVSAGTNYTISVGAHVGAGTAGNDSYFDSVSTLLAKGGAAGLIYPGSAAGGAAASGVGDTKYSGGAGGLGNPNGGGAGGAGGPDGNGGGGQNADAGQAGGAGSAGSGGAGGAGGGAGNGGNGTANATKGGGGGGGGGNNLNGGAGGAPGGAGGGGENGGGAGTRGQVSVTYNIPTYESLSYIDDVAFFNTSISATTIAGLYAGTLAGVGVKGLDKLSTSASYNSIFRKFFNVGNLFRLEKIRVPLTNDIDAGTSILVNCIVDDGSDIIPLTTINYANFPGQRYVVLHPPENRAARGHNNFLLEFIINGTTEIGIAFPIDIDADVNEYEK